MGRRQGPRRALRHAVGATALVTAMGLVGVSGTAWPATAVSTATPAGWAPGSPAQGRSPWPGEDSWAGGPTSTGTVDSQPATAAEARGVVLINTRLAVAGSAGAGTGIVLTGNGEVLTNYHVVEGASTISVTVAATGATYAATVLGHSRTSDVALLQLDGARGLATATVDDDTVTLGDDVTAVGNAGGTGRLTAADGTVTDLSSTITTSSEGAVAGETLRGLIETDADVVPGDSGGPLLDAEGEVVGIDTAASSGSTSSTIDGYAIPIADAMAVVQQVRSEAGTSTVQIGARALLGVQVTDGAQVAAVVAGSPAARAGLTAGDTITAVGSTAVGSGEELAAALSRQDVGGRVTISWSDAGGGAHGALVTLVASPTA